MFTSLTNLDNPRLMQLTVISLEEEDFQQAKEISPHLDDESQAWQAYLNALAVLALQKWLGENFLDKKAKLNIQINHNVSYLKVGEFKVCLLVVEHVLDEVVNLPKNVIEQPELNAHFYVVLEVSEEQAEVILRCLLRHDEIIRYCQVPHYDHYILPLSVFDSEFNHLLFYMHYLDNSAIPLPTISPQINITKLSQWLQGVVDESWQAIDLLINPDNYLALSTRNLESSTKRGKIIDLGMRLGKLNLALLVNIYEAIDDKLCVLVQLHPSTNERYLPANLKLTLLSKAGKVLQEVSSRTQDNYIQLRSFKGEFGKHFSIQVSLLDMSVKEDFEI